MGRLALEILLLVLPWAWVASAVVVLAGPARRSSRPAAATGLAAVMVLNGIGDFFLAPAGTIPWWLAAWKAACVLAGVCLLVHLRRDKPAGV